MQQFCFQGVSGRRRQQKKSFQGLEREGGKFWKEGLQLAAGNDNKLSQEFSSMDF